jgi:hypothetical protein
MIPQGPAFHKPKSIVAAKNILYASLFMGFLSALVRYSKLGIANNGGIAAIALTILGFLAIIFLIKAMNRCIKWARTALLVLICALVFTIVFSLFQSQQITGVVEGTLLVLQALLQILSLFFLYSQDSNIWLNKGQE